MLAIQFDESLYEISEKAFLLMCLKWEFYHYDWSIEDTYKGVKFLMNTLHVR